MRAKRVGGGRAWWFLGGTGLLAVLGWYFGYGNLTGLVRGADRGLLSIMSGCILAGFLIRALKWHWALGPGRSGVFLFFLAKTAGNWTPARVGELAPLLLKAHQNARVGAWIALDRAIEVAFTLLLGLVGAIALGRAHVPAWPVALAVIACVAASVIVAWWLVRYPGESAGLFGKARHIARRLSEEAWLLRSALPQALPLTLLAKITDVYAVILLCRAFGYDAGFPLVCAARCAHGLVSAIPFTPDATGVPFVAAAWLLHEHGGIPYDTLTAALALEVAVINAILWLCFCLASFGHGRVKKDDCDQP